MAASMDRQTERKEGQLLAGPVAAGVRIWKGTLLCRNTTGYRCPGADTTGYLFDGVAYEGYDNRLGADADGSVRVERHGIFSFAASGMAITDVGKAAFLVDDQTVGLLGQVTNAIPCGTIVDVESATKVWVDIHRGISIPADYIVESVLADPAAVGRQAARVAKAQYDFATHGGAQGTLSLGVALPIKALVLDGMVEVLTPPTGSGATIAVQTEAANDIITAAAVSGAPWSTGGLKDIIPVGTAATAKKMTAARNISVVIGTADLTAGKFNVFLRYVVSD